MGDAIKGKYTGQNNNIKRRGGENEEFAAF